MSKRLMAKSSEPDKSPKVVTKVRLTGALWSPAQKDGVYLVVAWRTTGALQIVVNGQGHWLTVGDEARGYAWESVE